MYIYVYTQGVEYGSGPEEFSAEGGEVEEASDPPPVLQLEGVQHGQVPRPPHRASKKQSSSTFTQ